MTTNVHDLHKILRIPTIDRMIKHKLCLLGHLINHKHLPEPISKLFGSHGGEKKHHYPTRHKNIPNLQQHQSYIFNRGFLCQSLVEYVKLPSDIKTIKSINGFNAKIKKVFSLINSQFTGTTVRHRTLWHDYTSSSNQTELSKT